MIFCVSYNIKPPKITNPPYVAIDCRPAPTTEVAGRNRVPGNQTQHTVNMSTAKTLLNSTQLSNKTIKWMSMVVLLKCSGKLQNQMNQNLYMLFAGREVRIGKNCARGPYSRPRAQFFPIRTDLGRQITCLLFSSVEYFVSSFCVEFSLQPFSNPVYACV